MHQQMQVPLEPDIFMMPSPEAKTELRQNKATTRHGRVECTHCVLHRIMARQKSLRVCMRIYGICFDNIFTVGPRSLAINKLNIETVDESLLCNDLTQSEPPKVV